MKPVASRNPPTPAEEHPPNQNAATSLTRQNATSGLEGPNLEGDANESDSEDRPTVPGDDDPADSEGIVPGNSEGPAPHSDAEAQPDADSEDRPTVPGDDDPADLDGAVPGNAEGPAPNSDAESQSDADAEDQHEVPEIHLKSYFPRDICGRVIILLRFAAAAAMASFTTYYGWNGLFPNTPSPKFLWDKPNNSIFAIGVMSFVSTLFVNNLANATYDRFRWTRASRDEGIGALDWLACSPSTSISRLLHLALSRFPSIRENRSWHRLFAIHRLLLLAFQATISVVLMLNVTITAVYFPIPNTTLSGIGGVIPLDQEYLYYQQLSRTAVQGIAVSNYLSTQKGFFISAQLTVIGVYPAGDRQCAPGATSCIRAYLTQAPVLNGTTLPQPPIPPNTTSPNSIQEELPYVRFWNSPIYDITFSTIKVPAGLDGIQGTYGYEGNALILVAVRDTPEPGTSNSSIFLGLFYIFS